MAIGSRTPAGDYIQHIRICTMDFIEIASAAIGSAIMLAMFGLAARRSWVDRKETERQLTHRTSELVAA